MSGKVSYRANTTAISGEQAMSRLADRLTAMAPPPLELTPAQAYAMPRPSAAVAAAMSTSAAITARAAERARRSRSVIGLTVDGFVNACAMVPYAVVAFAIRLIMARVFFFDGQSRINGTPVSVDVPNFGYSFVPDLGFSFILPQQVRADTAYAFATQLPVPPMFTATFVAYAEFILPAMLLIGFGTRFAALGLIGLTVLMQLYVMPSALWSAHIYWAAMLLLLVSKGAGQLSVDHIIRLIARR